MLRGYPLQQAARVGCLAGGAVVQSLGAELSKDNWRWLFSRRALVHSCLHAECNVVTAVHVYVHLYIAASELLRPICWSAVALIACIAPESLKYITSFVRHAESISSVVA